MSDRIAIWPDGVWCYEEDIEAYMTPPCAKSDDFVVVPIYSEEGVAATGEEPPKSSGPYDPALTTK